MQFWNAMHSDNIYKIIIMNGNMYIISVLIIIYIIALHAI